MNIKHVLFLIFSFFVVGQVLCEQSTLDKQTQEIKDILITKRILFELIIKNCRPTNNSSICQALLKSMGLAQDDYEKKIKNYPEEKLRELQDEVYKDFLSNK